MMLWLMFALLTAAVLTVVLRPLFSAGPAAETLERPVLAVYRHQLAEIDADLDRGQISAEEAESARREVSRRLLATAQTADETQTRAWVERSGQAVALLVPVIALGTYLVLGSPGLPGRPHAGASGSLAEAGISELVRRVEQRLATHPEDGQGWDVVAPVYFRLQRFDEAAAAFSRAISILGETSQRLAGFAEATVMANNGIVTEPARLAYTKLAQMEPERVEPKFWLALAKEQDGRHAEAAADYRRMLASAPADAPWRALVEERLAAVDPTFRKEEAPQARGTTEADAQAAAGMAPEDRARMIGQMVAGLAERLKTETQDAAGWRRLVQSYVVLGDREKAVAALGEARRHLAGNPSALEDLKQLATALGLGS
jgi:cytochrome c-type biogenesis protein CcmH